MEYVAILVAVGAIAAIAYWQVTVRSRVFVVRVRDRVPSVARGKVSQAFVTELADVLRRHSVRRGAIYGVRRRGAVLLGFSPGIPQAARQALRNVWSMHGR
jgi:Protein of unknown function (DUF3634)